MILRRDRRLRKTRPRPAFSRIRTASHRLTPDAKRTDDPVVQMKRACPGSEAHSFSFTLTLLCRNKDRLVYRRRIADNYEANVFDIFVRNSFNVFRFHFTNPVEKLKRVSPA